MPKIQTFSHLFALADSGATRPATRFDLVAPGGSVAVVPPRSAAARATDRE